MLNVTRYTVTVLVKKKKERNESCSKTMVCVPLVVMVARHPLVVWWGIKTFENHCDKQLVIRNNLYWNNNRYLTD